MWLQKYSESVKKQSHISSLKNKTKLIHSICISWLPKEIYGTCPTSHWDHICHIWKISSLTMQVLLQLWVFLMSFCSTMLIIAFSIVIPGLYLCFSCWRNSRTASCLIVGNIQQLVSALLQHPAGCSCTDHPCAGSATALSRGIHGKCSL